jgi:hypothetical protein
MAVGLFSLGDCESEKRTPMSSVKPDPKHSLQTPFLIALASMYPDDALFCLNSILQHHLYENCATNNPQLSFPLGVGSSRQGIATGSR